MYLLKYSGTYFRLINPSPVLLEGIIMHSGDDQGMSNLSMKEAQEDSPFRSNDLSI